MNFETKLSKLIDEIIKEGYNYEYISYMMNRIIIQKTDLSYRLDQALPTSRDDEPADLPDGDSVHTDVSLEDLNTELDRYMSHRKGCKCYMADNECPICFESICDSKLECCGNWYHQKCLRKWFYEHDKCPTCRSGLAMDKDGNVIADYDNKSSDNMSNVPSITQTTNQNRNQNINQHSNQNRNQNINQHRNYIPYRQPPPPPPEHNQIGVISIGANEYREINHNLHLRQNNNGSIDCTGIYVNNILFQLTEEEKNTARSLGFNIPEDM